MKGYGRNAFEARLALIDLAESSLDLQYYIWDADVTGRLLADRLVRAADRGVRVRLLLDDHSVTGRDEHIAQISGHPNISIRAFNPYRDRSRWRDFFTEPSRVNRRSHNKVFVADRAVAVVGGRNIADHYFGVHGESNYRDLDAITVGAVVPDISDVFDDFWNSKFAVPYAAFVDDEPTPASAERAIETMRERMSVEPMPYSIEQDLAELTSSLTAFRGDLVWAPARVLYDDPEKVEDKTVRNIAEELTALTLNAQHEVLIENAYFVPRDAMLETVADLRARGVEVRVLTNSLVSNDVAVVYAGYAKYRDELLELGVEVFELRPDSEMKERWSILSTESRSGLHTKAMVVDREHVVIGSYNLDPRSADINSEIALLVHSREFGERVGAYLDEGVRPENAYHVTLEDGDERWMTTVDGEEVVFEKAPESTLWQRWATGFVGILPIQSQL